MPKFFTKKPVEGGKTFVSHESAFDPTKTYLTWMAPSRPFKKKNRSYFTTVAIIVVLLVLICLMAQLTMLAAVILAMAFVVYVLGFIPPDDIEYKISAQGITIGGHFYFWGDLDSFWLSQKEGFRVMQILTHLHFPGQLMLLLGDQPEEHLKKIVARFLPFHEIPPQNTLDKWAESLQKHFPLETPVK
jgi:hypothetical protein